MGRLGPRWRELLRWASRRTPAAIPRRRVRLTLLARLQGVEEAHVDLLRELASTGAKFEALTNVPEWSALVELKDELQAIATEQTRSASATDAQRHDGAVAYWCLEGLFGAVYRTIANGQKARQAIREAIKPTR